MVKYFINKLEENIVNSFYGYGTHRDYTQEKCLLGLRKNVLDYYALLHQEELLPIIVDFNQTLKDVLNEMYNRALGIFNDLSKHDEYGRFTCLEARCFLDYGYPQLHPNQNENRQELWWAISDSGWNELYKDGVTNVLMLKQDEDIESWNEYMLSEDVDNDNWNEGLDKNLTSDLHLIYPFHHLFSHTQFALTDFIYVRNFKTEIKIEIEK